MTDLVAHKPIAGAAAPTADHSEGMSYLRDAAAPLVTLYLPLVHHRDRPAVPVLLDGADRHQTGRAAARHGRFSPFWTWSPTFQHIHKLLFETDYPLWLWNTMYRRGRRRPSVDRCERARGLRDRAAALQGRADGWAARSSSPILCRRRSCSSRSSTVIYNYGLFDTPLR